MSENFSGKPASPVAFSLLADEVEVAAGIDQIPEPALITRADLTAPGPTVIAASVAMCELTKYTVAELIGRSPRILQGPLTDRAVLKRLRESCARGEHFVGEAVNYRKDGTTYIVQWTVDPIRDRDGRMTHFFSLQRDVTAQRQYANAWFEAEQRARAATEKLGAQMTLIAEAILVLQKTKGSFRSKELGQLRAQLVEATRAFAEQGPQSRAATTPRVAEFENPLK